MADEATPTQTPAAASNDAAPVEASAPTPAPETDAPPSPPDTGAASRAEIDAEIDDLWARVEGKAPEPPAEQPTPEPEKPAEAATPKAEEPPKPAEVDRDALLREAEERARQKLEHEQRLQAEADARVRAEAEHRRQAEAYVGSDDDYQAVNLAMRQAFAGDLSALNALDVVLPNGKRVSEVKGAKGLTEDEAANLLTAWDTARKYEDVIGDRKVKRVVDLWNTEIMSSRVLDDPDVDAAAVTQHAQPPDQMRAIRDSVRERVTQRLTAQHAEVVKAKDAEISKLTERVNSLLAERSNLTANRAASEAATVDRPGQPGGRPGAIPTTPDEIRQMSTEEFFRTGAHEELLSRIGNPHQARRGMRRVV